MSNISQDKLLDMVESRYALVVLAAKRARQLRENAPRLINTDSTNPLTVALEEIAAGKVTYSVADHDEPTTGVLEEPELLGLPTVPEAEDILPIPADTEEEAEMASSGESAVEETIPEVPEVVTEETSETVAEAEAEETSLVQAEVTEAPESTATEEASQPED